MVIVDFVAVKDLKVVHDLKLENFELVGNF